MELNKQETIKQDYQYCENIIKQHSKSFYYAFSRLPKAKAQAIFAIYAFCRRADDEVDLAETAQEQLAAVETLEKELALFEKGQPIDHPAWRALTDVFERYDMDIQPFYYQLTGQKMDIQFSMPETMSDLEKYCFYVAGSVGLMLLPVLASETDKDLTQTAVNLGLAMQLTNILRDIGEDFQNIGRVYIPISELEKENYSIQELKEKKVNDKFIRIWERLAQRAEELYDNIQSDYRYFDEDSRFPVELSANIYRGLLNAVRKNKYDCFTKRNYVSKMEMQRIYQAIK
ncbi:phytoene synthase [Carnobacterium sp. AT7]|uniref:phytoene/squalene synthase family protein n=1 Tax=Carnobacterium TaxID=2747 RepID=UPI00015F32C0|nr:MULTISPECIES: phytoene/squalene synthase family protein [Carnobacterium]EDP69179.1 phytoene synthase [Carnobacterium sp. AT7]